MESTQFFVTTSLFYDKCFCVLKKNLLVSRTEAVRENNRPNSHHSYTCVLWYKPI